MQDEKICFKVREGRGLLFYRNGDLYRGEFSNDVMSGLGEYFSKVQTVMSSLINTWPESGLPELSG